LPDNAAIYGIQCVNVVRFSRCNDRRPTAWAVINVKRLRINVTDNRAVKAQIARQICGSALCESRIDIETVTQIVIAMLRHIYLRTGRHNTAPQGGKDQPKNGK